MVFPNVEKLRVYLRPGVTDMRKSIDGLAAMAQDRMGGELFGGSLFVFCNRRRTHIKILYWDRTGFCLWLKRLEEERFPWPGTTEECREITPKELDWLLRGLDFFNVHKTLNLSRVS